MLGSGCTPETAVSCDDGLSCQPGPTGYSCGEDLFVSTVLSRKALFAQSVFFFCPSPNKGSISAFRSSPDGEDTGDQYMSVTAQTDASGFEEMVFRPSDATGFTLSGENV